MATQKPKEEDSAHQSEAEMNSLNGAGDARVQVEATVSIFEFSAGQTGYLSRTPEVESAIEAGLLKTI